MANVKATNSNLVVTKRKYTKRKGVEPIVVITKRKYTKRKGVSIEPIEGKFKNKNGEKKQEARVIMVNSIKEFDKPILSLPADTLAIEKMLWKKRAKAKFVLCENINDVYYNLLEQICKTRPHTPPSVEPKEIGEMIKCAEPETYSNLILDYCGQIGTFHDEITHAIKNNIVVVNGVIAITVNKRITGASSHNFVERMERLEQYKTLGDDETRTRRAALIFINKVVGFNYSIERVFDYHDTAAMLLIVIRRIA